MQYTIEIVHPFNINEFNWLLCNVITPHSWYTDRDSYDRYRYHFRDIVAYKAFLLLFV